MVQYFFQIILSNTPKNPTQIKLKAKKSKKRSASVTSLFPAEMLIGEFVSHMHRVRDRDSNDEGFVLGQKDDI